jgi:hypothetical protein
MIKKGALVDKTKNQLIHGLIARSRRRDLDDQEGCAGRQDEELVDPRFRCEMIKRPGSPGRFCFISLPKLRRRDTTASAPSDHRDAQSNATNRP